MEVRNENQKNYIIRFNSVLHEASRAKGTNIERY
jgi:hypothetical protein